MFARDSQILTWKSKQVTGDGPPPAELLDDVDPRPFGTLVVGWNSRPARSCCLAQASDQAGAEALANGDAVLAQGLGLLIGDVVAMDRSGASQWAAQDQCDDFTASVFLRTIQVVENRVKLAIGQWVKWKSRADVRAALRRHLGSQVLIDFISGHVGDSHGELPVEKRSEADKPGR